MGVSAFFGMFAGVYHWYPRMFGRLMNETLAYIHFAITFIGAYLIFWPMHFQGLAGVPRRYFTNSEFPQFAVFDDMNKLISIATVIVFFAQFIFLINFFWSIKRGRKSGQNPWGANTLEWTSPIEGIHGNWEGDLPTVYRWPYDYSRPGAETDFIPQTVPLTEKELQEEIH